MTAVEPEKLINDLEFLRRLSLMMVLIVDDQKNMVKTVENMIVGICAFKQKSQSIFRAYDGAEALGILENQIPGNSRHIDLVLLDWNMPTVPGIDVIRGIRSSKLEFVREVPVIMITGESIIGDVNEALYSGVDNYLLKPFVADHVRVRMNPLLRRYWSGLKMRRAKNRRGDNRYPAESLKMKVTVEFLNGTKKTADVINISNHSLRVEMDKPESFETKGFCFQSLDGVENLCEAVSLAPDVVESESRVQLSFMMRYGFDTPVVEKNWMEWVDAAKKNYTAYRGNTF